MNILSLDGGGVRGVISIKILKEIMDRAKKLVGRDLFITDIFDYFSGSSIGTVIISALLIPDAVDSNKPKYTIDEIFKLIVEKSPKLFELYYFQNLRTLWGFRLPKYINDHRQQFFSETLGDTLFEDLLKPVVFPCGDLISNQPIYFHTKDESVKKFKVWELLMGTTAAPSYFPSKELIINGKKTDLIDSGCVANDTSHLAFIEASNYFKGKCDIPNLYELSIGTGQTHASYNSYRWGALHWLPILADTLMGFNCQNQQYELSLTTDEKQRDRLNPTIPENINYMDYPQYIPQYIEVVDKWIIENTIKLDLIVDKLLLNKGLLVK